MVCAVAVLPPAALVAPVFTTLAAVVVRKHGPASDRTAVPPPHAPLPMRPVRLFAQLICGFAIQGRLLTLNTPACQVAATSNLTVARALVISNSPHTVVLVVRKRNIAFVAVRHRQRCSVGDISVRGHNEQGTINYCALIASLIAFKTRETHPTPAHMMILGNLIRTELFACPQVPREQKWPPF